MQQEQEPANLKRELEKLTRINASLMRRVEHSMAQQGSAYSLFHAAIGLESQVRVRTEELKSALIDLEKTNDDLTSARDTAERANRFKTRFFTAVGHDLLQPLHAARLTLSALAESENPTEQKRLVTHIDHALQTIEELLKTILDLSKLEAGVIQPSMQAVALDGLFASLALDIEPLAGDKALSLKAVPTRLVVRSDPLMLRRMLQNMLVNAVRYTEKGGIRLIARRRGGRVRIEVWDTGPGIPEAERDRIFEEFQRGSSSVRSGGGGFGLGLSIVQRMSQALDHKVGLCSQVGRGTCFFIAAQETTLALSRPGEPGHPMPAQEVFSYGFAGSKVLVLDNDVPVLDAMKVLLAKWGCSVETVQSLGDVDALIAAGRFRPDMLIADYHLDNDECGIDAIGKVRAQWGDQLPAVIVTADHSPETTDAAEQLGVEILRKPVRPAELRALIGHLLAR